MASTRQLVTPLTAVRTIHQSPLISWHHAAEIDAPRRPTASGESPDSPDTPGVEFREHHFDCPENSVLSSQYAAPSELP
jgi:hypothetical protein